jgi:hypothetical protein
LAIVLHKRVGDEKTRSIYLTLEALRSI